MGLAAGFSFAGAFGFAFGAVSFFGFSAFALSGTVRSNCRFKRARRVVAFSLSFSSMAGGAEKPLKRSLSGVALKSFLGAQASNFLFRMDFKVGFLGAGFFLAVGFFVSFLGAAALVSVFLAVVFFFAVAFFLVVDLVRLFFSHINLFRCCLRFGIII